MVGKPMSFDDYCAAKQLNKNDPRVRELYQSYVQVWEHENLSIDELHRRDNMPPQLFD